MDCFPMSPTIFRHYFVEHREEKRISHTFCKSQWTKYIPHYLINETNASTVKPYFIGVNNPGRFWDSRVRVSHRRRLKIWKSGSAIWCPLFKSPPHFQRRRTSLRNIEDCRSVEPFDTKITANMSGFVGGDVKMWGECGRLFVALHKTFTGRRRQLTTRVITFSTDNAENEVVLPEHVRTKALVKATTNLHLLESGTEVCRRNLKRYFICLFFPWELSLSVDIGSSRLGLSPGLMVERRNGSTVPAVGDPVAVPSIDAYLTGDWFVMAMEVTRTPLFLSALSTFDPGWLITWLQNRREDYWSLSFSRLYVISWPSLTLRNSWKVVFIHWGPC